jgi:hypothetical protein
MPGGTWQVGNLPVRSGTYINFVNAVTAALAPGTQGAVGIVGTASWGPSNTPTQVATQGDLDNYLGGPSLAPTYGGTVRDGALQALDGFDDGGATSVIFYRAVAADGAPATVTLKDSTAAAAVTLSGYYDGVRANDWSVTVLANPSTPANMDVTVWENAVPIAQFLNIPGGTNSALVSAIMDVPAPGQQRLVTATLVGTGNRALALVSNTSAALFAGGNDGSALAVGDYAAAQTALEAWIMDAVALCNCTDAPTLDQFVAWIEAYNQSSGFRTFGVIGGAQGEGLSPALLRSYDPSQIDQPSPTGDYDDCDVVNAGATDILRLSDGAILSTAYLAPRIAGAVVQAGIKRSMTGVTWTGYRVNNPLSNQGYISAVQGGVFCFRQDDPLTVSVESGVTAQVTSNTATDYTARPAAHAKIRNVAIDHFIADQLTTEGNANRGQLLNTGAGRANFLGNVIAFFGVLEQNNVLQPGTTVALDSGFVQTGSALFLIIALLYLDAVEQFFFTIQVA